MGLSSLVLQQAIILLKFFNGYYIEKEAGSKKLSAKNRIIEFYKVLKIIQNQGCSSTIDCSPNMLLVNLVWGLKCGVYLVSFDHSTSTVQEKAIKMEKSSPPEEHKNIPTYRMSRRKSRTCTCANLDRLAHCPLDNQEAGGVYSQHVGPGEITHFLKKLTFRDPF